MTRVRRSILFSAADKYATQILLIVTTAVMSRILTPAETGLYLIANAVMMLADNFRSFGMGVFLVQESTLDRRVIRTAFTTTLLISLAMGAAIASGAEAIAGYFGEPDLAELLRIAAVGLVALPFASPIVALLQRDLAFGALAKLNVAAATVNAVATIGLGLAGVGPASYLWGFVISSVALAALAFAARPQAWIFRPCFAETRRLLSFGVLTSLVALANLAYDMLPRFALGRVLGADAVALYARALMVCQLPDRAFVSALHPVALPAMAAHARQGGALKAAYLRGLALMSGVQWPALAMLALLADPVVRVLLGPQWTDTPPLVRIMAPAMMALAPAFMTFPVLVAVGRLRDALAATALSIPPSVGLILLAAPMGLKAVAAILFVAAPLQMLVALLFVRRAIGMSWAEMAGACFRSVAVTAFTVVLPAGVIALSSTGFDLDLARTAAAAGGGALGWIAGVVLIRHPLTAELAFAARAVAASELLPARLRRFRDARRRPSIPPHAGAR